MGLIIAGSTSGTTTIDATAIAGTGTLTLPTGTDTLVGKATTDTLTNKTLTSPTITGATISTMNSSVITSGTVVATTSGTSIDFTGIPSWVKRITVIFNGVSTNGSSVGIMRLGTSSGIVTSGYASGGAYAGIATNGGTRSDGLLLDGNATGATVVKHGHAVITNITGNTWAQSFVFGQSDSGYALVGGGSIALSGVLDRVRLTTVNGTDTFDAGSINILYE
jgi:hypothetical protein